MAERDIAKLGLEIDSSGAIKATKNLDRLEKQSGETERATDGVTKSSKMSTTAMVAYAAVVSGAALGLRKLVTVSRQFDIINASLITVTGSTENAAKAFDQIKEFAATTPFALQEVANSFVKLKALGLDPSEQAMQSYGNTAAAMGKSMNQMIEAVADASTGEFERLKEFGIKAKSQGDDVSFTFRGITQTIGKNSEEIQGYLLAIGENEFAGAMAQRADSLDGAISNLGDTWDNLFLTISQAGVGETIETTVRMATDAIKDFDTAIETGQFDWLVNTVATLTAEFLDLGNAIGAYAAIAASAFALDFDAIDTIVERRKEERAATDLRIEKIWEEKAATDELNKSKTAVTTSTAAGGGDGGEGKAADATGAAAGGAFEFTDRFDAIRQSLLSEEELFDESYERRRAEIQDFIDFNWDHADAGYSALQDLETKHQQDLNKIARKGQRDNIDQASNALGAASELATAFGNEQLGSSKELATAEAIMSTYSAAMKQYDAAGGGWAGAAAAAVAIAYGLARVQKIQTTQLSSKTASDPGGGTQSPRDSFVSDVSRDDNRRQRADRTGPQEVNITVDTGGMPVGREAIEAIVEGVRELFADGGRQFE
jgi:hypothetical protein